MMEKHVSDVARFRQQQELQEDAAKRGLYGPAVVANHESITARMQRGAEYLLQLIQEGKHEQVALLMETETWGLEESGSSSHSTTPS